MQIASSAAAPNAAVGMGPPPDAAYPARSSWRAVALESRKNCLPMSLEKYP